VGGWVGGWAWGFCGDVFVPLRVLGLGSMDSVWALGIGTQGWGLFA